LPAYLVAAFIKRLVRLTLWGPPSAPVVVIPFIYNLLMRHPSCMVLIHRGTRSTVSGEIAKEAGRCAARKNFFSLHFLIATNRSNAIPARYLRAPDMPAFSRVR
jgi:hypothetical protein